MEEPARFPGGHGLLPNLPWVVAVPDGLPDDAVADAVHTLMLRHEVLRTAFDADRDPVARRFRC